MKTKKRKVLLLTRGNHNSIKAVIVCVLILRILFPPLILVHPLLAYICNQFLDSIDGQLFFEAGFSWKMYNRYDKLLDYWMYIMILGFFWLHSPQLFPLALFLFLFRSIGQAIGIIFNLDRIYFFFPNVFELFFFFTLVFATLQTAYTITLAIIASLIVERGLHLHNDHWGSKYFFKHQIQWELNEAVNKKISYKK